MWRPTLCFRKWIFAAIAAPSAIACTQADAEETQSTTHEDADVTSGGAPTQGEGAGGSAISSGAGGVSASGGAATKDGGGTTAENNGGAAAGGGSEATAENGGGAPAESASRANCKRGVAYGYHSINDLAALSPGVSWWYNWDFLPDTDLRDGAYLEEDVEYVPMIWGAASDQKGALTKIPEEATYLLGFNEPNFGEQANISAKDAAALWPELESLAKARGLQLISPAVNFCGGDCQDSDPFRYLEEFLAACESCRVDAVAMHIYVGCSPSGDNKAEWLINHVESYKSRFEHPLWLTEFACNDPADMSVQVEFLEDAVAYLEGDARIQRYAWFAGRADNMSHVDLLGPDGELTSLGQAYVDAPQDPDCLR